MVKISQALSGRLHCIGKIAGAICAVVGLLAGRVGHVPSGFQIDFDKLKKCGERENKHRAERYRSRPGCAD
jgi:hypothetical protein